MVNKQIKGRKRKVVEIKNRTCAECATTNTPLWRGGPAGPRSLCNACGIKRMRLKETKKSPHMKKIDKSNTKKIDKSRGEVGNKLSDAEIGAMLLMDLACATYPF